MIVSYGLLYIVWFIHVYFSLRTCAMIAINILLFHYILTCEIWQILIFQSISLDRWYLSPLLSCYHFNSVTFGVALDQCHLTIFSQGQLEFWTYQKCPAQLGHEVISLLQTRTGRSSIPNTADWQSHWCCKPSVSGSCSTCLLLHTGAYFLHRRSDHIPYVKILKAGSAFLQLQADLADHVDSGWCDLM